MSKPIIETVDFDTPIEQAGHEIKSVKLRKPKAGELRGLKLLEVLSLDVNSISALLPRITDPALSPAAVEDMDLDDFTSLCSVVTSFFAKQSPLARGTDQLMTETD